MEQNMPRFTLSFLIGCIFIGGCNLPSTDQSIPEFDSKPVVWLDEWPRENEISKGRRKAETLLAMGDKNKRARNFGTAEMHYKFASDADPTWAYPAYQTACAFDLWGKPEEAAKNFQKAIDLGFDDYPTVLIDDDLVSIRKLPNFDQSLQKIRDNYITNGTKNVGQPIAIPATGNKPPGGWPMILLLHGYADSNLRYLDKAKQWAALGFVAVAVPGSTPLSANAFRWNSETIETTQKDLQSIVQSKQFDGIVNREKCTCSDFPKVLCMPFCSPPSILIYIKASSQYHLVDPKASDWRAPESIARKDPLDSFLSKVRGNQIILLPPFGVLRANRQVGNTNLNRTTAGTTSQRTGRT